MLLHIRSRWLVLILALVCTAEVRGDSVTLVSGEKISGTIKSEADGEVVIDVPVSASITDERVIRKEDIAKIEKEAARRAILQAVDPAPAESAVVILLADLRADSYRPRLIRGHLPQ